MSRRSDFLAGLVLVALSLSVPTALGAWLLATPEASVGVALVPAGTVSTGEALVAERPAASPALAPAASPPVPVLGVLYTRGLATVNWNGVGIPVENGTYAYVGGESVTIAPDAMGVLRLAGGGTVFVCPGASATLGRAGDGAYRLEVATGSSRFSFPAGQPFVVDANGIVVGPSPGAAGPQIGEVDVPAGGGCVLCGLGGTLSVAGGIQTPAGKMAKVTPAVTAGAPAAVSVRDIPASFAAAYAAGGQAGAGAPFLCRCREIERYASEEGLPAEDVAAVLPGEGDASAVPSAPPVEPPGLPALALAEPGAPDPFDPNVLPPPAAGPGTGEGLTFTVPPPLIPSGGSGGGGSVSPS